VSGALDIDRHYGAQDICARIDAALLGAGKDLSALTRADLSPFDEFHGGGLASTRDLAHYAGLASGQRVLDLGCGVGGPARTLAAEFNCSVTGVDLTRAFVTAAERLTARVGLESSCRFQVADATALPFAHASFDVVWSQNMLMNVADKARCFAEVARVLKPGGCFAFEAVLAGDGRAVHLPTFWAARADLSHLVTRRELATLLEDAGLLEHAIQDTTAAVIAQGRKRRAAVSASNPRELTIGVIVPDDVALKVDNALKNNEEGRTVTVKALYRRAPLTPPQPPLQGIAHGSRT
jgi:ubiquinone/menaquinone biosynthesis C-methylase UbiE